MRQSCRTIESIEGYSEKAFHVDLSQGQVNSQLR